MDEQPLHVIEIIPKKRFFDYEAKYGVGLTDYIVPARIEERLALQIKNAALLAHRVLGCLGCSRVDLLMDNKQRPIILEVNTIPGLTETSLLPKAAAEIGIDFAGLCIKLLDLAINGKTKS